MIKEVVYAILQFFIDSIVSLVTAYTIREKAEEQNDGLIENLKKAEGEDEQQAATNSLSDDFDK